jgi:hypothetical protein
MYRVILAFGASLALFSEASVVAAQTTISLATYSGNVANWIAAVNSAACTTSSIRAYAPNGTYNLPSSEIVVIPCNGNKIRIVGQSTSGTIFTRSVSGTATFFRVKKNGSVVFDSLTLTAKDSVTIPDGSGATGIRFDSLTSTYKDSVLNSVFNKFGTAGIDSYNSVGLVIKNNTVNCANQADTIAPVIRGGMGIWIRWEGQNTNARVLNNTVRDCFDESIIMEVASGNYVSGNTLSCSNSVRCEKAISINSHLIANPTCTTPVEWQANDDTVTSNTIRGTGTRYLTGIFVGGAAHNYRTVITNNTVDSTRNAGIWLSDKKDYTGLDCGDGTTTATYLRWQSVVTGNALHGKAWEGEGIHVGGDLSTVNSNTVSYFLIGVDVQAGGAYINLNNIGNIGNEADCTFAIRLAKGTNQVGWPSGSNNNTLSNSRYGIIWKSGTTQNIGTQTYSGNRTNIVSYSSGFCGWP